MTPANEIVPVEDSVVALDTTNSLRKDLLRADDRRAELVAAGDWQTLAWGLVEMKKIKADLDALVREVEENIAALLPDKKATVDGLGVLERRTSSSRKWDSEGLLRDLVRKYLDPEQTGELTVTWETVSGLIAMLQKALPLTGSLGWRVTPMREHGINPDDYSEVTYGRSTVQITN
jgi:hypothetical protein